MNAYSQGFNFGVNASYGNTTIYNPSLDWASRDTIQYFTWAPHFGLAFGYFFKSLEYYHKRLYGFRINVNHATHAQERENYFYDESNIIRLMNRQRTVLNYLDIPILFTFARSHNQGLYVEVGPQWSILLKAKNKFIAGNGEIEQLDKSWFRQHTISGVIAMGTFYHLSETIAFNAGFRGGYCFNNIATKTEIRLSESPTKRFWLGINAALYYKINQYAAKKNRGLQRYVK
ncbi:MAG: outer membrane beta-barrel protein [Flavobacteriales bacterium]